MYGLIQDINITEICSHIASDNLADWCNAWRIAAKETLQHANNATNNGTIEKLREKFIGLFGKAAYENDITIEPVACSRLIDYLIANGATVQEWIPVTERRPTYADTDDKRGFGFVEVYSPSSGIDVSSVEWVNEFINDITYWRPLPEPPKEIDDGFERKAD